MVNVWLWLRLGFRKFQNYFQFFVILAIQWPFQMIIISMSHYFIHKNPSQNCNPCQKFIKSKNLIHFDDHYERYCWHFYHQMHQVAYYRCSNDWSFSHFLNFSSDFFSLAALPLIPAWVNSWTLRYSRGIFSLLGDYEYLWCLSVCFAFCFCF